MVDTVIYQRVKEDKYLKLAQSCGGGFCGRNAGLVVRRILLPVVAYVLAYFVTD